MKTFVSQCLALVVAIGFSLAAADGAQAQNRFGPRLYVNDKVITNYEFDQRVLFLTLLGAQGDIEKQALDALIDDKIRLDAGETYGVKVTEEQLRKGMEEFASRANLDADKFVAEIGKAGVEPETFREFVKAGMIWRDIARAKFGPRVSASDAAVDRALANRTHRAAIRVLLSELIIPAESGQQADALALANRLRREARGEAAFGEAARAYSAAPSAPSGGRLEWLPLENLPPALAPMLLKLSPGEVSEPVKLPNAVAIFLLRAVDETSKPAPDGIEVDYAALALPDDATFPAELARIRAGADACDDLYTLYKGASPQQLRRETAPLGKIPSDLGLELAKLDPGEISTALKHGGTRTVLMLCARRPVTKEPIDRNRVAQGLVNQTLGTLADGYLADLRAKAIIRQP